MRAGKLVRGAAALGLLLYGLAAAGLEAADSVYDIASRFEAVAGSEANAVALVEALHGGSAVEIVATDNGVMDEDHPFKTVVVNKPAVAYSLESVLEILSLAAMRLRDNAAPDLADFGVAINEVLLALTNAQV